MRFGATPLAEAEGAILAHSLKLSARSLRKGRVLTAADIEELRANGISSIIAARLETDDVPENAAADIVAGAMHGELIRVDPAFTGRANFYAEAAGLCVVDRAAVDRFNLVDEAITLATVAPDAVVAPKEMVATLKIIPFAVKRDAVERCAAAARNGGPLFRLAAFRPHRVTLLQTRLPGVKASVLEKTVETTAARLGALGSRLVHERRTEHDEAALAPEVDRSVADGSDLVLIAGASAIVDRRDVIPAAIVAAGGVVEHFGMPVDPGNLLLLGRVGAVPVLGLPGCARSPKVNGFDWVLRRILAGLPTDAAVIAAMGVGGLLSEIPSRPLPRAMAVAAPEVPRRPRIAALVLAAGRSSRMGTLNKLLISVDGRPMVRHAVDQALAANLAPVVVVTGHQHERVESAIAGLPIRVVHNPAYAEGLSTSLKAGLGALPPETDAVLICLADMPRVTADEIGRLVAAFNPVEGRAIVIPTWQGKRGNPVLWAKQFFGQIQQAVAGDVGARHLIGTFPEAVAEVEMEGDGVLTDIDTPQALSRLAATAKIEV